MDPIETPCLGTCLIDPNDGLCMGCARSLDEIARWSAMSDAERRAIMQALPDRRPRQRKGGRRARLAIGGASFSRPSREKVSPRSGDG
jgi:predicted Fe-S protein YdhL (DUF1289 family)